MLYDFRHELSIDILDYFTGRRTWAEFYDFLAELPEWGKFKAALAMDEDHSQFLFEQRKKAQQEMAELEEAGYDFGDDWAPKGRSPEGYDPVLAGIYGLDERVQILTRVMVAANGGKPGEFQKAPRPVTGLDILEMYEERDDMSDLAGKFRLGQR